MYNKADQCTSTSATITAAQMVQTQRAILGLVSYKFCQLFWVSLNMILNPTSNVKPLSEQVYNKADLCTTTSATLTAAQIVQIQGAIAGLAPYKFSPIIMGFSKHDTQPNK